MSTQNGMDRRDFVKLVGAGLMAAGAARLSAAAEDAAAPAAAKKFKKACGFEMVKGEFPVLEKFKLLKEVGFEGIEVQSDGRPDREEFVKARDATGLVIHSVMNPKHWKLPLSSPDPKIREQCLESVRKSLEDAKYYGASTILLVPAVVNKEIAYDEAYTRSQAEIRKLIPDAEKQGVVIGLEYVWNNFLLSPLEFARYVDEFKSPMVQAYLDAGNLVRYGWPEQWVRILGKRICKVHIKEFSRKLMNEEGLGRGFEVKLNEGDCDWPAVMKALREVGYSGWITAEVPGGRKEQLKDISERMDKIFAS